MSNLNIPQLDLKHMDNHVPFALRTMEEIHLRTKGAPDHPHRHNYYTILWSKNACGIHLIDYKEYTIEPNKVFFVNPGQVHQVITYGEPQGVVMMFTLDFLQQNYITENFIYDLGVFSDFIEVPPLMLDKKIESKLIEITDTIKNLFLSDDPFKMDLIGSYLKIFLIECNKNAFNLVTENTQTLEAGRSIVRNFKRSVNSNYSKWHKVSEYANELAISADYLNNVIKSTIGKTAKEFIQNRIILESKRLGIYTDLSTKEIAYQIGFEDPAHFSKFFKTQEKNSFSSFRNSLNNKT